VAKGDSHVAFSAARNSYFIVSSGSVGCDLEIGQRLPLRFEKGLVTIDNRRQRER
jgi:hypothetical protein